jgi:hypothetical protein
MGTRHTIKIVVARKSHSPRKTTFPLNTNIFLLPTCPQASKDKAKQKGRESLLPWVVTWRGWRGEPGEGG